MKYIFEWTFLADNSYQEEINFIYLKWNIKEAFEFEELVANELERLSKNPSIGRLGLNKNYSLVISKQTTIYYKVREELKTIQLLLFWNNLKNPADLIKLL